jgi:phage shock protein A
MSLQRSLLEGKKIMANGLLIDKFQDVVSAFDTAEQEMSEEIEAIEQQIEQLKDRIVDLNGKLETLAHDKQSIEDMVKRYAGNGGDD